MNKHLDHQPLPRPASPDGTGRLDHNMGHELRSPLVTIIAQVETLLAGMHGPLTSLQHAAVEGIQSHTRQALALITDMVDLGRIAEASLQPAPCDLEVVSGEALQQAGELMRSRSIKSGVRLSPPRIHVLADAARLRRMISELMHATALLAAVGEEVRLLVSTTSSGVRLEARPGAGQGTCPDPTAAGVPVESSMSFQKLVRLKPIGLAFLQALVRLHDGQFLIQEASSHVEALILELPLPVLTPQNCANEMTSAPAAAAESRALPGLEIPASPLILLADDQPTLLTVTRNYLEERGYRVEAARDGLEAVEMALRLQPDLILMDVRMPMLDGHQAVARIRASSIPNAKTVPIICASGMMITGDKEKCLAAGANDYLAKPYGIKQIDSLLAEHLQATPIACD